MDEELIRSSGVVSMFCRLNINFKRDIPVRSSEMGLLILICNSDKPITPVIAADFFKVRKSRITVMVSNLVKHGYIQKMPLPSDKRSFVLNATEKAKKLVDDTFAEYIKNLERLRQGLGQTDFSNLVRLLERANSILLEGGKR